jgi:hypothetical protein
MEKGIGINFYRSSDVTPLVSSSINGNDKNSFVDMSNVAMRLESVNIDIKVGAQPFPALAANIWPMLLLEHPTPYSTDRNKTLLEGNQRPFSLNR